MPIQPIWLIFVVNGLDCQCCLAGSSKTDIRVLISSNAMGADYSFDVKKFKFVLPPFFKHIDLSVATLMHLV